MPLEAGDCLDNRYLLIDVIGKGGTSTVYLAVDQKIHRERAIKAVTKSSVPDEAVWKKEQFLLKKLHHEHMAEIYDVLEFEETILFVMEYLEGCTFRQLLEREEIFSIQQTLDFGIQICEVLSYLHGQNPAVIHRDIKPSNLMLCVDGNLKLIDFGTAREYRKNQREDTVFWGTPGYAAPEQTMGQGQTDARADIYSLGVTLYELAYGRRFAADSVEHPQTVFEEIIAKATRFAVADRYSDANAMKADLENYEWLEQKKSRRTGYKRYAFILLWAAVIFCAAFSWNLDRQAERICREGYERYMSEGEKETDSQERINRFAQAVQLNPWKSEAYMALLEEYRLRGFHQEDYAQLLSILKQKEYGGAVCVECLRQSKEEYTRFVCQLGIACFFEWEGYGSKKFALPWLTEALDSGILADEEYRQISCLKKIASYYEILIIPARQIAGQTPEEISFGEYWNDLMSLESMETDEKMHAFIQREIVSQIIKHAQDFYAENVSREEMLTALSGIAKENKELEPVASEGMKLLEVLSMEGE